MVLEQDEQGQEFCCIIAKTNHSSIWSTWHSAGCERSKVLELLNNLPKIYGCNHTFSRILRIGSTTLLGSTVPQVTLGSKGVNAK